MNETKWTKGPWSVGYTSKQRPAGMTWVSTAVHVGDESNRGNCIAVVHMGGSGATSNEPDKVEANAHLIAAAPEMYEALAMLLDAFEGDSDYLFTQGRKLGVVALAKARGAQ